MTYNHWGVVAVSLLSLVGLAAYARRYNKMFCTLKTSVRDYSDNGYVKHNKEDILSYDMPKSSDAKLQSGLWPSESSKV